MKSAQRNFAQVMLAAALLAATSIVPAEARTRKSADDAGQAATSTASSVTLPAAGSVEVAFSPNEGSEALVVKAIDSAKGEVLVMAYSFTSAPVVEALSRAVKRGAKVRVVADEKSNVAEDRSGKARAALSTLSTAGADVRVISVYPISHDKVIIVDRETVETGSFNYSAAAAQRNSENVLVLWHNPDLAKVYLGHFDRNYRQSKVFSPQY